MLLSGGFWLHGISGAALVSPVLGALAVLLRRPVALTARSGPGRALVLAITLPEVYTSRSAFAEPVLQILLFGGLCLLIDSLTLPRLDALLRADRGAHVHRSVDAGQVGHRAVGEQRQQAAARPLEYQQAAAAGHPVRSGRCPGVTVPGGALAAGRDAAGCGQ
jgi:hypothetical protein